MKASKEIAAILKERGEVQKCGQEDISVAVKIPKGKTPLEMAFLSVVIVTKKPLFRVLDGRADDERKKEVLKEVELLLQARSCRHVVCLYGVCSINGKVRSMQANDRDSL